WRTGRWSGRTGSGSRRRWRPCGPTRGCRPPCRLPCSSWWICSMRSCSIRPGSMWPLSLPASRPRGSDRNLPASRLGCAIPHASREPPRRQHVMADKYQRFTQSPVGKWLAPRLGLPQPAPLRRYRPGQPPLEGPAVVGGAPGGRLAKVITEQITGAGIDVLDESERPGDRKYGALVFDASGITDPAQLREVYAFFKPRLRSLGACGRTVVLGTPPELTSGRERIAQRALEGFTRSLGKELIKGSTSQLVYVAPGSEEATESTM